jgi:hypothetical protein
MALACDVVILAVPEKQGLHDVELGTTRTDKAASARRFGTRCRHPRPMDRQALTRPLNVPQLHDKRNGLQARRSYKVTNVTHPRDDIVFLLTLDCCRI